MKYLLLFFPCLAYAGPYFDIGIADGNTSYTHSTGDSYCSKPSGYSWCYEYGQKRRDINSPLGLVELGYELKNLSAFYLHISSIPDHNEKGLNLFGIKYRFK